MVDLKKDVKYVKGVGPNRVTLLNGLGIFTLEDLISHYPRDYEDRSKPKKIAELIDGEEVLIEVFPVSRMTEIRAGKMKIYKLVVRDDTGTMIITWFNQSYLKNRFKMGEKYKFFGKVNMKYGKMEMNSPVYDSEETNKNTGKIIPIYPSTYGLSQNTIRTIIENGLNSLDWTLEETLPDYLLSEYNLESLETAIHQIHFPNDFKEFERARKRLVFEELLTVQIGLLHLKNK